MQLLSIIFNTFQKWLCSHLEDKSRVGVDGTLVSACGGKKMKEELEGKKMELVNLSTNLVDLIWKERPGI